MRATNCTDCILFNHTYWPHQVCHVLFQPHTTHARLYDTQVRSWMQEHMLGYMYNASVELHMVVHYCGNNRANCSSLKSVSCGCLWSARFICALIIEQASIVKKILWYWSMVTTMSSDYELLLHCFLSLHCLLSMLVTQYNFKEMYCMVDKFRGT